MTPQPDRYEWVSVHEASRRLNRSTSTIRRMIESGELIGEREPLAKGSNRDRYRVRLDAPATPQDAPKPAPPSESPDAPEGATEPPGATTRALEILAETTQAQSRQIAAQAETIAALSLRVGRAEALAESLAVERAQAKLEVDELRERLDAERARSWWKRLIGRE